MSRRQWIGLAGVLFGAVMLAGMFTSGTTPDSTGSGAGERYQEYWSDSGNQDRASIGAMLLTYACVALASFAAGLRWLLRRHDDSPLPSLVLGAGAAAAALLGVGSVLVNSPGVAAAENGYQVDGNAALHLEAVGYYVLATGIMLAGTMAVAAALSNRRVHLLPGWTAALAACSRWPASAASSPRGSASSCSRCGRSSSASACCSAASPRRTTPGS